uniref:transglycosylase SLT domain-containing protein n=1 Tax=Acinetobacter sp. CFCC 10889 TaxID=1775557 RepID=UPI0013A6CB14
MASKLGSLTLDLIARVGDFVGPIQQAENQSNTSFGNMRNHINTYGTAVVAAAGAAALGLAALTSEYVDQATELERMAFRSNTTTQEFQKLAAGAAAYGIEQEQLADQLKDFNEKLGELTTLGSGAGIDFFEQIAMKTEGGAKGAKNLILQMQKLSGPQALQLYIDKLEEAGVTHQQMSFYLESMGSDLTNLIPLFANGGEAAKIYGDAAERAGIIMSDNTIQQTKILKEQVYLLDLQMQGAKNQLMQAVIPAFVDISEAFFSGSEQGQQFTGVADGVAKTLKGLAAVAIGAVTAFQLVGKTLGGMAAIGGAIYDKLDWYEMNPLGLAKAAYEARTEIANLSQELKTDLHSTVIGSAERLNKLWDSTASGSAKKLAEVRTLNSGVTTGLDELVKKKEEEAAAENKAAAAAKANAEAKYKYTQEELKMLQRVSDLAAKNNLNGIGARYGVPNNMLAALMAQESGGDRNAVSPTGAIGYFQTTSDYRKDNKISIADSKNLPVIAEVVAKNLAIAYEKLGSWEAAIRSHNAGVGGSRQFENTGRVTGSAARNKEVANFAPSVDKWFVAFNGSDDANSGFIRNSNIENLRARQNYNDAVLALDEKLRDLQKQVHIKYQTELEAIEGEHLLAIADIQTAFISDETTRDKYLALQKIAYEKDVSEFKKAEQQKVFDALNAQQTIRDQIQGLGSNTD